MEYDVSRGASPRGSVYLLDDAATLVGASGSTPRRAPRSAPQRKHATRSGEVDRRRTRRTASRSVPCRFAWRGRSRMRRATRAATRDWLVGRGARVSAFVPGARAARVRIDRRVRRRDRVGRRGSGRDEPPPGRVCLGRRGRRGPTAGGGRGRGRRGRRPARPPRPPRPTRRAASLPRRSARGSASYSSRSYSDARRVRWRVAATPRLAASLAAAAPGA